MGESMSSQTKLSLAHNLLKELVLEHGD